VAEGDEPTPIRPLDAAPEEPEPESTAEADAESTADAEGPKRRRPYKFTPSRRAAYLDRLREGYRRGAAAEAVGVTRQLVTTYCQADKSFSQECEQAELDANEPVEDALYQAALSGNVRAAETWLYNRSADRWKRRLDVTTDLLPRVREAALAMGIDPDLAAQAAQLVARQRASDLHGRD
jgi:hypothetical protein